jgi:nucleotidyltransferase substrate binding protein (TIGR01987 family)
VSERFEEARDLFFAALRRLEEVVAAGRVNPFMVDAAIQRFEFTFETAWRALKYAAADQGVDTASPRRAFEAAYTLGLIEDDGGWTGMLGDRNETSHTYKEALAEALYARLPEHLARFQALAVKLSPTPA